MVMPSNVGTAVPGQVLPTSDKAHLAVGLVGEQKQADSRYCAGDAGHGKALATMRARAALCGCTLHEMADGTYLLGRWNYSRAVPCLRAVGDLLRRIGGTR